MNPISTLGFLGLTWLGKPACNRSIYKAIQKYRCRSIVEVGLGSGERALSMIRVARKFAVTSNIRYTGIDMFDARTTDPLPLIEMHRNLQIEGVKSQLVPGTAGPGIARIANSHVRTDLVILSSGTEDHELAGCWFYLPRMLHSTSLVMLQRNDGGKFECLNRLQVEKLANKGTGQSVKAA
ncbi:MAG: hypothetical protein AAF939_18445 [Planctomycetota bacterium]